MNRAVREKELTEKKMSNAQRGPVPPPRGPSDRPDHIMEELKSRNYQLQEKVGCGLGILCNGLVTNFFLKNSSKLFVKTNFHTCNIVLICLFEQLELEILRIDLTLN